MRVLSIIAIVLLTLQLTAQVPVGFIRGGEIGSPYPNLPFTQVGNDAVISKGGTILGWDADAIAAPSACWDGTRWVGAISIWSIADSQWATAFGTSPDLVTWTWVKLQTPTGGDYIFGNGGIGCYNGHYYYAYSHYPAAGTGVISVETSTDLITWTQTLASLLPGTYVSDGRLTVNPALNRMELWYDNWSLAPTTTYMVYGTDGITWTSGGMQYEIAGGSGQGTGTYPPTRGGLYYTNDQILSGDRYTQMVASSGLGATWTTLGLAFSAAQATIVGMTPVQCFDGFVVWGNGDHKGPGNVAYLLNACGDNTSGTDNTDSSIVLSRWHN